MSACAFCGAIVEEMSPEDVIPKWYSKLYKSINKTKASFRKLLHTVTAHSTFLVLNVTTS
jgi:hypothetical protein